jgi:7-cyano-7-deazaguanine synthase
MPQYNLHAMAQLSGTLQLHDDATVGLLLSGGLDSAILLGHLLRQGCRVQPLYVDCRLVWQEAELLSARRFAAAVATANLLPMKVFTMPLADLYEDHWSITGRDVPDATSPDEAVFLPGRNVLLVVKPALWCRYNGIGQLALAVLKSNPFADATEEFFAQLEILLTNATGRAIRIVLPFRQMHKREVMVLGGDLPLELTFSCIAPTPDGRHCGRCNKCAERRAAFQQAGLEDRTHYAA